MINVTVMYPNAPDKTFDMDYYLAAHIPMVKRLSGSALKDVRVSEGIGGAEPGANTRTAELFDAMVAAYDSPMFFRGRPVLDEPREVRLSIFRPLWSPG